MEKAPRESWHGAHHYSGRVHLFFLFFLFLAIGALVWSYFSLNGIAPTGINKPTPTNTPTCVPRPFCLDEEPRCLIPETSDMCPPTITPTKGFSVCDLEPCLSKTPTNPKSGGVVCTQDAKRCPDGSFVGRTGPNCKFAKCPGE